MSFNQSTISDVSASRSGDELAVVWSSTAPAGTWFQVYLDRALAWHGTSRQCRVPHPAARARVEVGAVLASERGDDLSAQLPAAPGGGSRLLLTWLGGTYLDPAVAAYRVYTGTAPGGAVDYSKPAGIVAAYPQGQVLDGWNLGGWDRGGWGESASSYQWLSPPKASGTWNAAVKAVDAAGNEGPASAVSATVTAPPAPPARNAAGVRLTARVVTVAGSPVARLTWLASPG